MRLEAVRDGDHLGGAPETGDGVSVILSRRTDERYVADLSGIRSSSRRQRDVYRLRKRVLEKAAARKKIDNGVSAGRHIGIGVRGVHTVAPNSMSA